MDVLDDFWSATSAEQKQGFVERQDRILCLLCGKEAEQGVIYPVDGFFYDARRYMRHHIEQEHGSVFMHLSHLDKKLTGLSEHQITLLRLFYQGLSDVEVQQQTGIGSTSTIRNHRFVLKEKERQAKVFLTMMELLKERDHQADVRPSLSGWEGSRKPNAVLAERKAILSKYLPERSHGGLIKLPRKQKEKRIVLEEVAKRFEPDRLYTEPEVNEILQAVYEDYVTVRRYLVDFGLLDREADGSNYWLHQKREQEGDVEMDRRQVLKMQYKETKPQAGVYQIKNVKNGKVLIMSSPNLKTMNGKKFMLQQGTFPNPMLQKDLEEWGADAFEFEVLEVLEDKNEPGFRVSDALEKLEEKWLDKIKPYNERGYNQEKRK
ncbi:DUF2087 domain-containing protein [Brevibacillus panacihumi]|uniref:DUF2087 domain-containing protein n=1 Tax=Brevibacillus panacihumi TaxID=497735 RepID=A0A3M8DCZ7_9BACL|nr:DUF2087 domain-containing protein [Brevibacillus panacihumi]RNB86020.1 DUF2087 domain-containing protein [Brevibacillus panacihumi]